MFMDLALAIKMAEAKNKNKLSLEEKEERKRKREQEKEERRVRKMEPVPSVKVATVGGKSFFLCQYSGIPVSRCFQIPTRAKDGSLVYKGSFANASCALAWLEQTQKPETALFYIDLIITECIQKNIKLPRAGDPKQINFLGGDKTPDEWLKAMKHQEQWGGYWYKETDRFPEINSYLAKRAMDRDAAKDKKGFKKPRLMTLDTADDCRLAPLDGTDLDGFLVAVPVSTEKLKETIFPDDKEQDIPLLRNAVPVSDFGKFIVVCRSDKANEQEVREFKGWLKKAKKDE